MYCYVSSPESIRNLRIWSSSSISTSKKVHQPSPLPKSDSLAPFGMIFRRNKKRGDPNIIIRHGIPLKTAYDNCRSIAGLKIIYQVCCYWSCIPKNASLTWWSIWMPLHHPIQIPHFEKDPTINGKIHLGQTPTPNRKHQHKSTSKCRNFQPRNIVNCWNSSFFPWQILSTHPAWRPARCCFLKLAEGTSNTVA